MTAEPRSDPIPSAATRHPVQARFMRGAVQAVLAQVAGLVLTYLGLMAVGRLYDPASYGLYLYALSIGNAAAFLTDLGFNAAQQRAIARGEPVAAVVGTVVRIRLALAAAFVALLSVAWFVTDALGGSPLAGSSTPGILLLVLVAQVAVVGRGCVEAVWVGQHAFGRLTVLATLDGMLTLVALLHGGSLVAGQPDLVAFWRMLGWTGPATPAAGGALIAGSYAMAKLVVLGVALAWARREGVRAGPWDATVYRGMRRLALPLVGAFLATMVVTTIDTLLLGWSWSAGEVAMYGASQRMGTLCVLLASGISAALLPGLASLDAQGDGAGKDALFHASRRAQLMLSLPLIATCLALPEACLLVTFGPAYLPAAGAVRATAVWALAMVLMQPLKQGAIAEGRTHHFFVALLMSAVASVALNLLLVTRFGALGSATATAAAAVVALAYMELRHAGLARSAILQTPMLSILAAAAGMVTFGAGAYRIAPATWFDRFHELAIWTAAGCLVYGALLLLLRALRWSDVRRAVASSWDALR